MDGEKRDRKKLRKTILMEPNQRKREEIFAKKILKFPFSHEMPCQRENKYIYVKHGNVDCVRDNVLIVIKFYGNFSWQFLFFSTL